MPDEDENFGGPLVLDFKTWLSENDLYGQFPPWDPPAGHHGSRIYPNKCPVQDYECNNRKLFKMKDLIVPEEKKFPPGKLS